MRSLWADPAALANTLPKLQKVGDELVANSGHCGRRTAGALFAHEIAMTDDSS